ncbi:DUF1778 domain-containing protein [Tsukamurella pseudospumae]|uniref:Toxin-antitoxin system protein n=1 Tax=Tsukamurella pseudospumae TaxID=239498 RepID=A0A138ABT8_9ACTN|nr:DUF1778 domain-containing protein [Tsukamurella pseudospumae]KXP07839.1 toxin-antitoxin system protein [Tsukamurella pseudospumae]
MTAAKTRRLEIRVDEETVARINRAASIVAEPASEFLRKAALSRAEEVLRDALTTSMPADQFDELLSGLDRADEAPALAELARRPRVYRRS